MIALREFQNDSTSSETGSILKCAYLTYTILSVNSNSWPWTIMISSGGMCFSLDYFKTFYRIKLTTEKWQNNVRYLFPHYFSLLSHSPLYLTIAHAITSFQNCRSNSFSQRNSVFREDLECSAFAMAVRIKRLSAIWTRPRPSSLVVLSVSYDN